MLTSEFKKSSECGIGACVEAKEENGYVFIRNSENPNGQALVFNIDEWNAFIKGVKASEFDIPSS